MFSLGTTIDITRQTVLKELKDLQFLVYLQLTSGNVTSELEAIYQHLKDRITLYEKDSDYEE